MLNFLNSVPLIMSLLLNILYKATSYYYYYIAFQSIKTMDDSVILKIELNKDID